ncbi:O-acetyl-ADP-ribose deacetylase [Faecalibacterium prausnitzii]|jgi:O-acetyl-ADP-ribose deacetylase (regulator of RNase III)|nr:O-acetyl-ADP-ribose deacetylase [Faecalibacterium prausnitzii]
MISEKVKSQIQVVQGDITKLDCDGIVNAANRSLLGGGGVDGAIHRAAGPELLAECRTLHGCRTGEAKITKGYRLKAKYIIHTVGPIYSGTAEDAAQLTDCYRNSLELAKSYDVHSIAFPAISTGVYGYPLEDATEIAVKTVAQWLEAHADYAMQVIFCCFDARTERVYQTKMKME